MYIIYNVMYSSEHQPFVKQEENEKIQPTTTYLYMGYMGTI